jgi:hypothetical protein
MEVQKYYRYFNVRDFPQNNVKRKAKRLFRNKNREYLRGKINVLATNGKDKHIRNLYSGLN